MAQLGQRKCLCCGDFFDPEHRNRERQRFCSGNGFEKLLKLATQKVNTNSGMTWALSRPLTRHIIRNAMDRLPLQSTIDPRFFKKGHSMHTHGGVFVASVLALALAFHGDVSGCSPIRMKMKRTPDGQSIPDWEPGDYVLIGEVLGEETVMAKSSTGTMPVSALRIRVVSSETQRAVEGEVLNVYQFTMGGSACEHWGGRSLSTKDMPVGSKVRLISRRLDIPIWEIRQRLVRIVTEAEKKERVELMRQQCKGSIHGAVCAQNGGVYLLGRDGKLAPAKPGWNPTD